MISPPRPVVRLQNNFTIMFLMSFYQNRWNGTQRLNKMAARAKIDKKQALQGLLSLLMLHRLFFPFWHITWSFPAGASHGLAPLLVFHKFPALKFCHNNQTKWLPLMDISWAMAPSLLQALFSDAPLPKIAMLFFKQDISKKLFNILYWNLQSVERQW